MTDPLDVWHPDHELLEEIALTGDLIVRASLARSRLTVPEIDEVLGISRPTGQS